LIVADASAILEVLLNTPAGAEVGSYLFADDETIHAPHLLDLEILQGLRRYARSADIGTLRAERALQYYAELRVNRYPHDVLAPRVWQLRHNWTAYDAAYIALAEALDAPLLTRDRALASSGHRAKVLLF
jgi:predicted nucleic acid-binding protein